MIFRLHRRPPAPDPVQQAIFRDRVEQIADRLVDVTGQMKAAVADMRANEGKES